MISHMAAFALPIIDTEVTKENSPVLNPQLVSSQGTGCKHQPLQLIQTHWTLFQLKRCMDASLQSLVLLESLLHTCC